MFQYVLIFTPKIAERWTNGWRAMLRKFWKNSPPPSACGGVSILTCLVNFNLASLNFVWVFFHVLLAFHLDFCQELEMEFHLPFVLVKVTGKKIARNSVLNVFRKRCPLLHVFLKKCRGWVFERSSESPIQNTETALWIQHWYFFTKLPDFLGLLQTSKF